jgi:hypothetical protein
MVWPCPKVLQRMIRRSAVPGLLFWGLLLCGAAGCQKTSRTDDPQLKPIQALLDEQISPGASETEVMTFLDKNAFPIWPPKKQGTIVATIRKKDKWTAQMITARATFYFDANHKLNTFELQRTSTDTTPQ